MRKPKSNQSRLYRYIRVLFYRKRYILVISFCILAAMILGVYKISKSIKPIPNPSPRTWAEIKASDTLRAVTIESSFSAFKYNDQWYGHEYDNAKNIANALGLQLEILRVKSEQELADSIFSGAADVIIWPMSYTIVENHWFLMPTGPRWQDSQCIASAHHLQLEQYQDSTLTDSLIESLPHYNLSIVQKSRQWLVFHNDSVRSHFDFRPFLLDSIRHDSLTNELITDSMIEGKTDAVMLRCNVARLMHDYYPSLVVSDTIPFSQDSVAWMVAYKADTLRHLIDSVTALFIEPGTPHYLIAPNNYRQQKLNKLRKAAHFKMKEGAISVYDDIFRAKGKSYNIDWRLLAAIGYIESNFNHAVISKKGPIGLMQLMPSTVRSFEYSPEEALNPEVNVELAAKLLCDISSAIRRQLPNISDEDMMYMSLAGYNAGLGHVMDAVGLADTLGYKTDVWDGNVEHCLRLKREAKYYNMEVVKRGKFNGAFTINYVNEVMAAYHTFKEKTKQ